MTRMHLGWLAAAPLLAVTCWSLRPALRAADPAPGAPKSPQDMKPSDAKPAVVASSPLTWPPGEVIFTRSDAERKLYDALKQPTEFDFNDAPLEDVAKFFNKRHEINIQLDRESLGADGKGPETPITKSLRGVTLGSALRQILDGQGLTFQIKNDVILILTKAEASFPPNLLARVYQVHDLIVAPNDPTAAMPDFDSLIEILSTTIRQNDWADNGGVTGSIKPFRGPGVLALVITHDDRGHEEIERLLKMMRAAKLQPIFDVQARQKAPMPVPSSPTTTGSAK